MQKKQMVKLMSQQNISPKTQKEALSITKGIQKPGQTKEQTKLIAQGIEKGIALYKKQQNILNRQEDKKRKKQDKRKQTQQETQDFSEPSTKTNMPPTASGFALLPWSLLFISWIGFFVYLYAARL